VRRGSQSQTQRPPTPALPFRSQVSCEWIALREEKFAAAELELRRSAAAATAADSFPAGAGASDGRAAAAAAAAASSGGGALVPIETFLRSLGNAPAQAPSQVGQNCRGGVGAQEKEGNAEGTGEGKGEEVEREMGVARLK